MAAKVSSPTVTSQIPIIRFHSKRGHFWFVFVKLSEIVGFSCLECHSSHKTNFKELILFCVSTTDFFIKVFRQKRNCPNFVAFDLKVVCISVMFNHELISFYASVWSFIYSFAFFTFNGYLTNSQSDHLESCRIRTVYQEKMKDIHVLFLRWSLSSYFSAFQLFISQFFSG